MDSLLPRVLAEPATTIAVAELADRGVRVLGLDRSSIPNDTGSSHGVNRIIRLAYAEDPRYVPLLRRALADQLRGVGVSWSERRRAAGRI